MNKNIEKEFKILVTKKQFEQLCERYENLYFENQTNVYFDTEDQQIQKLKGAMRIRTKNNQHIFTLKMYDGEDLLEYECEVKENNIDCLQQENIIQLLHSYHIYGNFIETAKLETQRAVVVDEYAELCFDISKYNHTTDYEIEYEFKKEHDGFTRFNAILAPLGITYEKNCISKIQRALSK